MKNTKEQTAVDSQVKVGLPVKTEKPVFIERRMSSENIGNEIASRVAGKLIDIPDVFNPKTGEFVSESELRKKGVNFVSISYKKDIAKDLLKKNRNTKEPTPWKTMIKTFKVLILCEAKWKAYLEKYSTLDSLDDIVQEYRQNGVQNYHCQTIGKTRADKTTINGIIFRTIEKTKYYDGKGAEVDQETLVDYLPKKSYKSMHEKYSIPAWVKLPQYRTIRVDNCEYVRSFGFQFIPTD